MKKFLCGLASVLYLGSVHAQISQTTNSPPLTFTAPEIACWNRGTVHIADTLRKVFLDYTVITEKEHLSKPRSYFVGARSNSQPSVLWLLNWDGKWVQYDANTQPVAIRTWAATLGAIESISIFNGADLSVWPKDAEIYVGYGLRTDMSGTTSEAFLEMQNSKRFTLIWVIGNPSVDSGARICTSITGILRPDPYSSIPLN